jgi:hypothetical protein
VQRREIQETLRAAEVTEKSILGCVGGLEQVCCREGDLRVLEVSISFEEVHGIYEQYNVHVLQRAH